MAAVPEQTAPVDAESPPPPAATALSAPRWSRRAALELVLRVVRPLPVVLLGVWLLHLGGGVAAEAAREPDRSAALAVALRDVGLEAEAGDVHWLDDPAGVIPSRSARPRAVVRANAEDAPADVYLVKTRLSPEGRLLEITGVYNLSDTSAVDEKALEVAGERAAWTITGGGKTYIVQLADLRGEPTPSGAKWTQTKRWQNRITNLQKTGSTQGIGRRSFKLDPAASEVELRFSDVALHVDADSRVIRIPTDGSKEIVGERFVREQPHHKSVPGNTVTWAVDRVRQSPWFSDDQMQFVKAIAFTGLDWLQRAAGTITGDDGSDDIAEEFGSVAASAPVEYTDPETGWPPPPMEPMLKPVLEGEGQWRALDKDPFVLTNPGAPSPFVMSFIRTDRKRAYTRIYVVLWDPRQVQLHTMSGTIEPKSATGETGTGMVPRKPEVLGRVLAGFNGGFQATHGEFGMVSDRVVYLPPKPYAATVAKMSDGSTGFGTWPESDEVPPEVVDMRQNMTPLVMDDAINPYRRNWWGGVPPGWKDEARTVRSAVCLTKENFVAYMYGASIDADHLAFAMERARCVYGIHLDMNPGHTGLEFYRAAPDGQLPEVGHTLDPQWEATGKVVDMPGWSFIGRRMLRYMGLMNFPRYIDRESRDFFYLTLRHVLPGEPAPTAAKEAEEGEGQWKVKGLPQHGWPYSIATTWVRPDEARPETKVRLLKIDPRAVRHPTPGETKNTVVVVHQPPGDEGTGPGLWHGDARFVIAEKNPGGAERIVSGAAPGSDAAARAVAAIGLGKHEGMLFYAEVATAAQPDSDARLLLELLARLGCDDRLLLGESLMPAIGGDRDLAGHPVVLPARRSVRLVRGEPPGARRIFKDTPIVAPKVWYPLQAKRVRYFRKPKPAEGGDEGGGASAGDGSE